jgi:hypothetical protein
MWLLLLKGGNIGESSVRETNVALWWEMGERVTLGRRVAGEGEREPC